MKKDKDRLKFSNIYEIVDIEPYEDPINVYLYRGEDSRETIQIPEDDFRIWLDENDMLVRSQWPSSPEGAEIKDIKIDYAELQSSSDFDRAIEKYIIEKELTKIKCKE
jgi:hypothetical protein